jgi:pyrroloquinoline-quinone synthase
LKDAFMTMTGGDLWDRETFIDRLRNVGEAKFRDPHPLLVEINAGQAAPAAVKRWIAGRFYHQTKLPRSDGLILANCPVRDVRRVWVERIMEHDGRRAEQGGIGGWLQLGEAAGLARRDLEEHRFVLPEVRSAVDEQIDRIGRTPWAAAVASTLTEMVAPDLVREPLSAFERHYTWIDPSGLGYFRSRGAQATRNTTYALDCTVRYCDTPHLQNQAVQVLTSQCEFFWSMLDALAAHEPARRQAVL